jgi:hypothetical protein
MPSSKKWPIIFSNRLIYWQMFTLIGYEVLNCRMSLCDELERLWQEEVVAYVNKAFFQKLSGLVDNYI